MGAPLLGAEEVKEPMSSERQHQLEQVEGGYACAVCQWRWKNPPTAECPGVKRYAYGEVPEHLVSFTKLRRRKLKPGEPAVGVYKRAKSPYEWLYFYDANTAQPRRQPTEAQQAAIAKMRAGLKKAHTCERCGWYNDSHGQLRRYDRGVALLNVVEDGVEQERRYCSKCRDYLIWVDDRYVIEHNMAVWLSESEDRDAAPFLVLDCETTGLSESQGF